MRAKSQASQALKPRLAEALKGQRYLMGDAFSVADLIIASTFSTLPHLMPQNPDIQGWVARCANRPAMKAAATYDADLMAKTT